MDYPELNLLAGLSLASTLGITICLLFLMNRQQFPSGVKTAFRYLLDLALIAAGYAYMILFPSLSLRYQVILGLAIGFIAGIAILAFLWLRHFEFTRQQRYILAAFLVVGLGLIAWLVSVLIRALIPTGAALLSQSIPILAIYPSNIW